MYMEVAQVSTRLVTSLKISEHLKHNEIGLNNVYTHIPAVSINKFVTEHTIHICIFHTASSKIHYTACILQTITSLYLMCD